MQEESLPQNVIVLEGRSLPIQVDPAFDDMGLDPYSVRVYVHLVRLLSTFRAAPSVTSIATRCMMSVRQVQRSLNSLEEVGMIGRTKRAGGTTIYVLMDKVHWGVCPPVTPDSQTPLPGSRRPGSSVTDPTSGVPSSPSVPLDGPPSPQHSPSPPYIPQPSPPSSADPGSLFVGSLWDEAGASAACRDTWEEFHVDVPAFRRNRIGIATWAALWKDYTAALGLSDTELRLEVLAAAAWAKKKDAYRSESYKARPEAFLRSWLNKREQMKARRKPDVGLETAEQASERIARAAKELGRLGGWEDDE